MRYFGLEDVNLEISEDVFKSKIGQVVSEKNPYELDAANPLYTV
jgi:hypothetical protein